MVRLLSRALLLALLPEDALAWGLQTHLFFAQHVLLLAPFADPGLRRAVMRFPRLVLAGACLPDLSLVGQLLKFRAFRRSHLWPTLRRFAAARCDEERALAIGYASHLLSDVEAHNRFVPEHESRVSPMPYVTHALCEWAMDEHVRSAVFVEAGDLIHHEKSLVAHAVAEKFGCSSRDAVRALEALAGADRMLRRSPMTRLCRRVLHRLDHLMAPRFEAYVRDTLGQLGAIEGVLEGLTPRKEPEPDRAVWASASATGTGRLLPPRSLR